MNSDQWEGDVGLYLPYRKVTKDVVSLANSLQLLPFPPLNRNWYQITPDLKSPLEIPVREFDNFPTQNADTNLKGRPW